MEIADYGIKGAIKSRTVGEAKAGDVVRFDRFSILVEKVSEIRHNKVAITGRISTRGNPIITRSYFANMPCRIEVQS